MSCPVVEEFVKHSKQHWAMGRKQEDGWVRHTREEIHHRYIVKVVNKVRSIALRSLESKKKGTTN